MTLWLVRGGADGSNEQELLTHGFVGIGWSALGDLTALNDRDQLKELFTRTYEESPRAIQTNVAQVFAFRSRIQIGDLVALPLKSTPAIAFGKVTGGYRFDPTAANEISHQRSVEWISPGVPRSSFNQDLLYSFGAFLTVCQVKRNEAEARVRAVLAGAPESATSALESDDDDAVMASGANVDLEQFALDQIRAHVQERYSGHGLAALVAAVLEAQGYTVHVSPPGPDNGVDVLAGFGENGFDQPRLAVQVKSGKQLVDEPAIRDLQGTMQNFGASHGLFVSWSGFNGGALKASRRLFFSVRLWDSDDLIRHLFEHYDALSDRVRTEIPLRQVWSLMPPEQIQP